jgi:hypothetical protein
MCQSVAKQEVLQGSPVPLDLRGLAVIELSQIFLGLFLSLAENLLGHPAKLLTSWTQRRCGGFHPELRARWLFMRLLRRLFNFALAPAKLPLCPADIQDGKAQQISQLLHRSVHVFLEDGAGRLLACDSVLA